MARQTSKRHQDAAAKARAETIVKKMATPAASPIDGHVRTEEQEKELNKLFARVFRGPGGKEALDYLEKITFGTIAGPEVSPNRLLHMEGSRFLYGIIKHRTIEGRKR